MNPTRGGSLVPKGSFLELEGDHVRRYLWAADRVRGFRVLDIGCGHGYGSHFLANNGAAAVVGVDTDTAALKFATSNYKHENLGFKYANVEGDGENQFALNSFQRIVCFEVIEHLRSPANLLEFAKKLMTKDGEFYLSTPNKTHTEQMYRNGKPLAQFHTKEYYPDELEALLSEHFTVAGIYAEYDVNGYDQELAHTLMVSGAAPIPTFVRRLAPEFLRATYFRLRGLQYRRNLGTFRDYIIEEVKSCAELNRDKPVQIFRLLKKNDIASRVANVNPIGSRAYLKSKSR